MLLFPAASTEQLSSGCCRTYNSSLVSFFIMGCKQRDDDDDDDDFCFVFWGIMWNLILESFTENKIFYILKKRLLQ